MIIYVKRGETFKGSISKWCLPGTCRGNGGKDIFLENHELKRFLELLQGSLGTYDVIPHAYVLMRNHFHSFLETPLGNVSEFIRHFNITYTSWFNRDDDRSGHLYQGRFKSILVERGSYLRVVSRCILLILSGDQNGTERD
nr:hypothetical protein [Desulfobacterales bacterium]